jgi:hypothetical protein
MHLETIESVLLGWWWFAFVGMGSVRVSRAVMALTAGLLVYFVLRV